MYTFKDQVIDAIGGVLMVVGFIMLWCAGAMADLAIVGF
jgi:hypothetical protein